MTAFKWNWQQKDWPNFRYDEAALEDLEYQFVQTSGVALGSIKHIDEEDKNELLIEFLTKANSGEDNNLC